MDRHLHLLARPDTRPLRDVHTWLLDGWRLVRRFPVLWAAYSSIGVGLFLLAGLIILALAELAPLFMPLWTVMFLCFCFVLQSGAYRLMSSISGGEKPRIHEIFWLPGENARKAFLRCLLFLVLLHGALMALHIFLIVLFSVMHFYHGTPSYTWFVRLIITGTSFMVFSISWAILPILSVFPETGFATLLRLQLRGTLRNWRPFCYFTLLVSGLFFLLFHLVESFFSSFMPSMSPFFLAVSFVVVALVWPLTFAWVFSAARHIFMVAE